MSQFTYLSNYLFVFRAVERLLKWCRFAFVKSTDIEPDRIAGVVGYTPRHHFRDQRVSVRASRSASRATTA